MCDSLSTGYATMSIKDESTFLLALLFLRFFLKADLICALVAFSLLQTLH
ncbi:MAG: hypothetical protein CM15mV5_1930 [uncultured marine virus]|nr:MAG: hypothetical protein CM15mV5_1930 [uncultured marine virus]